MQQQAAPSQKAFVDDDNSSSNLEFESFKNTLKVNIVILFILLIIFEVNRNIKLVYLKRLNKKLQKSKRVPPAPPSYPFGWIVEMMKVSETQLLHMVGLDGYMLLRYVNICFRLSFFVLFFGMAVLVPIYKGAGVSKGWSQYTLANIPDDMNQKKYWVPVVFAYLFSAYFCFLLYFEYKSFVEKRHHYLYHGDPDTHPQAYYTVMVERIPAELRKEEDLIEFFNNMFPDQVYCVEIALDLNELESLAESRHQTRDSLEKAIAIWKATGSSRSTVWVSSDLYDEYDSPPRAVEKNAIANFLGYEVYDAVEHYSKLLDIMNDKVRNMQLAKLSGQLTPDRRPNYDNIESRNPFSKQRKSSAKKPYNNINNNSYSYSASLGQSNAVLRYDVDDGFKESDSLINHPVDSQPNFIDPELPVYHKSQSSNDNTSRSLFYSEEYKEGLLQNSNRSNSSNNNSFSSLIEKKPSFQQSADYNSSSSSKNNKNSDSNYSNNYVSVSESENYNRTSIDGSSSGIGGDLESFAKEGLKSAAFTAKSAVRGVLEATRTLELLTFGAYYKVSSTAFVTLKSRQAKEASHQMLLCQKYYNMDVKSAPNPKDIIWANVSIPRQQIFLRSSIADSTLIFGALCWSFVVSFITAIGNLDSLSQQMTWMQSYNSTQFYQFLNSYIAAALLLCLLSMLPLLFDLIARSYEGMKLESEIQNSIMTRYFYYQLANIFVSVGLGSILNSLHQIIDKPASILSILGESVPQVSVYFTNLVIVKTFTALPLEHLRLFPLAQILSVLLCIDKKKCTRRELRTGAFEDPPMLYGWIYPNLMMILMIMVTYMCIAPLVLPFSFLFFGFSYLMYKYQLLYIYVTPYQSGGFMWYSVFSKSLVCLIGGITTLICYLGIRETFYSLPFYSLLPLPFCIVIFWRHCENKFKQPSLHLDLNSSIELDRTVNSTKLAGGGVSKKAYQSFSKTLFQQVSLSEGEVKPEPYRKPRQSEAAIFHSSSSSADPNTNPNDEQLREDDLQGSFVSDERRGYVYNADMKRDIADNRDSLDTAFSGDTDNNTEEVDRLLDSPTDNIELSIENLDYNELMQISSSSSSSAGAGAIAPRVSSRVEMRGLDRNSISNKSNNVSSSYQNS